MATTTNEGQGVIGECKELVNSELDNNKVHFYAITNDLERAEGEPRQIKFIHPDLYVEGLPFAEQKGKLV